MPGMIDQSVPKLMQGAQSPEQQAILDYLMGEEQNDALSQQALVDQLRDSGGAATPQMRGGIAPRPIEYVGTLANRLQSAYGQREGRDAEGAALEELRRKLYPNGGSGDGVLPGGVGAAPY